MLASTGTAAPRAVDLLDEGASRICRTARPPGGDEYFYTRRHAEVIVFSNLNPPQDHSKSNHPSVALNVSVIS